MVFIQRSINVDAMSSTLIRRCINEWAETRLLVDAWLVICFLDNFQKVVFFFLHSALLRRNKDYNLCHGSMQNDLS